MHAASDAAPDVEALVKRGLELRKLHRDEEALHLFEQAHRRAPGPRTLGQIGFAEQALGRWVDAEEHLQGTLATADDPWVKRLRPTLDAALAEVRTHLGSLEIRCAVVGAHVFASGRELPILPWTAPVSVEAGTITVEVDAPGYVRVTRLITVKPGALARETIELFPSRTPQVASPAEVAARDGDVPREPSTQPSAAKSDAQIELAARSATVAPPENSSAPSLHEATANTAPGTTPAPVPLYRKWWLWTAIGGGVLVVGGAAVGIAVATRSSPFPADAFEVRFP